jgi:hypothetical protein
LASQVRELLAGGIVRMLREKQEMNGGADGAGGDGGTNPAALIKEGYESGSTAALALSSVSLAAFVEKGTLSRENADSIGQSLSGVEKVLSRMAGHASIGAESLAALLPMLPMLQVSAANTASDLKERGIGAALLIAEEGSSVSSFTELQQKVQIGMTMATAHAEAARAKAGAASANNPELQQLLGMLDSSLSQLNGTVRNVKGVGGAVRSSAMETAAGRTVLKARQDGALAGGSLSAALAGAPFERLAGTTAFSAVHMLSQLRDQGLLPASARALFSPSVLGAMERACTTMFDSAVTTRFGEGQQLWVEKYDNDGGEGTGAGAGAEGIVKCVVVQLGWPLRGATAYMQPAEVKESDGTVTLASGTNVSTPFGRGCVCGRGPADDGSTAGFCGSFDFYSVRLDTAGGDDGAGGGSSDCGTVAYLQKGLVLPLPPAEAVELLPMEARAAMKRALGAAGSMVGSIRETKKVLQGQAGTVPADEELVEVARKALEGAAEGAADAIRKAAEVASEQGLQVDMDALGLHETPSKLPQQLTDQAASMLEETRLEFEKEEPELMGLLSRGGQQLIGELDKSLGSEDTSEGEGYASSRSSSRSPASSSSFGGASGLTTHAQEQPSPFASHLTWSQFFVRHPTLLRLYAQWGQLPTEERMHIQQSMMAMGVAGASTSTMGGAGLLAGGLSGGVNGMAAAAQGALTEFFVGRAAVLETGGRRLDNLRNAVRASGVVSAVGRAASGVRAAQKDEAVRVTMEKVHEVKPELLALQQAVADLVQRLGQSPEVQQMVKDVLAETRRLVNDQGVPVFGQMMELLFKQGVQFVLMQMQMQLNLDPSETTKELIGVVKGVIGSAGFGNDSSSSALMGMMKTAGTELLNQMVLEGEDGEPGEDGEDGEDGDAGGGGSPMELLFQFLKKTGAGIGGDDDDDDDGGDGEDDEDDEDIYNKESINELRAEVEHTLEQGRSLLEGGLIGQADFDELKRNVLGRLAEGMRGECTGMQRRAMRKAAKAQKQMGGIGALGSGSVGLKAISGVIGMLLASGSGAKSSPKAAVSTAVATSVASPSAASRAAACVGLKSPRTQERAQRNTLICFASIANVVEKLSVRSVDLLKKHGHLIDVEKLRGMLNQAEKVRFVCC